MENCNNEKESTNLSLLNSNSIILKSFQFEVSKSICQIEFKLKYGSGFLIKLEKGNNPFYCLMSCEHIINKYLLKHQDSVIAYYNHGKNFFTININKSKRFVRDYTYINIDVSVIEILPEDNIEESFFLRQNYMNYFGEILKEKI